MKKLKRSLALFLGIMMLAVFAIPVFAESSKNKEEIVYVNLNAEGENEKVTVVNVYGKGDIVDYGDYENVKLLNSNENVKIEGDKIEFTSDKDRIYLQADPKTNEMPWIINIEYYLDGKRIKPEDLAGKSGEFKMNIKIDKNPKINASFFDKYVLDVSFKLDTKKFKNIKADNATMANEGENKVIKYLVLPKEGLDTTLYADAYNFRFDGIDINALNLNLDIDFDKLGLDEKINTLTDAMTKLNDGSSKLSANSGKLLDASNGLNDATKKYTDVNMGIINKFGELAIGEQKVNNGLVELSKKSDELTYSSNEFLKALEMLENGAEQMQNMPSSLKELAGASAQIKTGISGINDGLKKAKDGAKYENYLNALKAQDLNLNELNKNNELMVKKLEAEIAALKESAAKAASKEEEEKIMLEINAKTDMAKLIGANMMAAGANEKYFENLSVGLDKISENMEALNSNYAKLDQNVQKFAGFKMSEKEEEGLNVFKSSISEMKAKYSEINDGIGKYTEGVKEVAQANAKINDALVNFTKESGNIMSAGKQLSENSQKYNDAVNEYINGTKQIDDAISEIYGETNHIKDNIKNEVSALTENESVTSFASEKNKNVKSVQFVIKTEKIELKEGKKIIREETQHKNLVEKFLDLFK
ncbi:MAG: hypothetical protein MSH08_07715 [Ezakiella sp.]|nr:hypothetical protein [Ezakiella sp.]MDD7471212.1 hypothetical protein [Bacillota bacterium]MDY3923349.1 hypothetical protein [Ezakiella sp.]